MLQYHSIPAFDRTSNIALPGIGFNKIDGSNLRFCWQRKSGWCKFGTRHHLFGPSDPEYGIAIDIFKKKYAEPLEKIITEEKSIRGAQEVTCFLEFFGPHSFSGQHDPKHFILANEGVISNDPKDLILFDISVLRKGFVPSEEFVRIFGHLHIPDIIYQGTITPQFIQDVREGKYPVKEGVVCKGLVGKAPHGIWMKKVKTFHYLDELKRRCGFGWERYV